jgi:putative phosphotransacetylase
VDQEILRQIIAGVISRMTAYSLAAPHPESFPIGVSNRHIHLSQHDLELLFGKDYNIHCQRDLSQPGQCAASETVIIAGPKGSLEQVRVLGPVRKQTQVEVSRSDTFRLGVTAPTRESGKLEGSGEITVIGPNGSIQLKEGLITAKRHIHMTPADAHTYGVSDGQPVQVKVDGERGVIFDNVVVRVSDRFFLEFHIDMDEANGAGIRHGDKAYLISGLIASNKFGLINTSIKDDTKKNVNVSKAVIEEPSVLVTEETVRRAWKQKAALVINKGVICTPLARDVIKELGVEAVWK